MQLNNNNRGHRVARWQNDRAIKYKIWGSKLLSGLSASHIPFDPRVVNKYEMDVDSQKLDVNK